MAAIGGVSDAYNLAKLFSLAIDGTLLNNRTLAQITQPTMANWHLEQVFLYPFVKGRGFFFEKHPINKVNDFFFQVKRKEHLYLSEELHIVCRITTTV